MSPIGKRAKSYKEIALAEGEKYPSANRFLGVRVKFVISRLFEGREYRPLRMHKTESEEKKDEKTR